MGIRKKPDGSVYVVDALWGNKLYYYVYFCGVHFIFVFFIPCTMLLFFCVRLIIALRKATRQQVTINRGSPLDTRITSMLLVLIAIFLFCHSYLWLYNILFQHGSPETNCIVIKSLYMSVFLYIVFIFNSSVNCFIYLGYLKEFRRKLCSK